jgi:hypothetical protein
MMKKILLASLALTLSTGAFAESIKLVIEAKQVTTYKKLDKNTFTKINVQGQARTTLDYIKNDNSAVNLLSNLQALTNSQTEESITVISKNVVKIVDSAASVNAEVEADISKSIFGGIKAITISSSNMESVYGEAMKKAGLDVLKGMNLGRGAITSDIKTSEMSCVAEAELLKCNQEQLLTLEIKK